MEYLDGVRVKYTHPAFPPYPYQIHISWIYRVVLNDNQLFISDGNLEQSISKEYLISWFSPINYNGWEDIISN